MNIKDINQLKIVINNDKCMSSYINDICKYLDKDGLKYELSNDLLNTDTNRKIVITLDQINNTGIDSTIITSYDNSRCKSHALSLALRAAFISNGVNVAGLYSGKVGFNSIHLDGKIPSDTEDAVDSDVAFSSISFCLSISTILAGASFGTKKLDSRVVADILIEAIARYNSYIKYNSFPEYNLIYRTTKADKNKNIEYIKNTVNLKDPSINVDKGIIVPGQTIIGNIADIKEFDSSISFSITK